jgi:hypothetical protein
LQNAQKYTPQTYIFDIGGSFRSLTTIFGGSYLNVGQHGSLSPGWSPANLCERRRHEAGPIPVAEQVRCFAPDVFRHSTPGRVL